MSQRGLAVVSVLCVWVASTQAALYSPAARFFADAAAPGRASPARPGGWRIAAAPRMYGDEEDAGPHSKEEDDSYSTCDATRTYLASTMESGFSRYTDEGSRILNAPQRYSSKDWLRTLLTLGQDRGLIAVRSQFLSTVAFSLLVSLFYIRFPCMPTLPALPHSLLGGVLSVLLGFRTNQSYQRFWEGRTLWGQVFDRCRTTLRTAQAYMDGGVETYETILRHLKAFPTALKQHLRGERFLEEFRGSLNPTELNELASADNMPLSLCTSLAITINAIKKDERQSAATLLWWSLDEQIRGLSAIIADCERLVRTPVPVELSAHTSRLVTIWTGSLPFLFVGLFSGWSRLLAVPTTAFVAYGVFCTEELGHMIEEPFGCGEDCVEVLPLQRYCDSLIADLDEQNRVSRRALDFMREMQIQQVEEGRQEAQADAEAFRLDEAARVRAQQVAAAAMGKARVAPYAQAAVAAIAADAIDALGGGREQAGEATGADEPLPAPEMLAGVDSLAASAAAAAEGAIQSAVNQTSSVAGLLAVDEDSGDGGGEGGGGEPWLGQRTMYM